MPPEQVFIATSNEGKLRDFAGACKAFNGFVLERLPGFASLPPVDEDGLTFEDNARKKAAFYSRYAPSAIVVADDSGLEVPALDNAPGVRSARYAADGSSEFKAGYASLSIDEANNQRLLKELDKAPEDKRAARFVCVLAAAEHSKAIASFRGEVHGIILRAPRGQHGFGYDPLFYVPSLGKTTAELTPEEKARISHRGEAFRRFVEWYAGR